ncbi:MAG: hypothetical protein ICV78_06300 [Tolypothrix sp. Co-bin9]|nr:hypothetical protein [Tolypothrix sp. Co-bin9]
MLHCYQPDSHAIAAMQPAKTSLFLCRYRARSQRLLKLNLSRCPTEK